MQGGWKNKDPYAQLPFFDIEHCKKLKQKWNKTLYQYCRLPKEERVALASTVFGKEPE